MSDDACNNATVRQTIITSVEAPKLRGVSTKHFIEFRKQRELYEKQVREKNKEPGNNVPLTSYKSSIEDSDLKIFIAAGWVEARAIDDVTELQLRQCVADRCHRVLDGEHLHIVEDAIKRVSIKMHLFEAEDRVWTLHRDYLTALQSAGYEELPSRKPHISIQHMLKRIKPPQLLERIKSIVMWRKDEQFDKKDFNAFMREVAAQAKKLQDEKSHLGSGTADLNPDLRKGREAAASKVTSNFKARHTQRYMQDSQTRRFNAAQDSQTRRFSAGPREAVPSQVRGGGKRKRDGGFDSLPICLNPKCGGRHFVQSCDKTDEATKTRLKEEYRAAKRARLEKGKIASVITDEGKHHSALFSASFEGGGISCKVLADQGADANLLPPAIFAKFTTLSKDDIITLSPPRSYKTISGNVCVTCEKAVVCDVQLKIRHGSNLILRNVRWLIANEKLESAILGRPVLESLGCDNRSMLQAASSRHDGDIDVAAQLEGEEDSQDGSIAALFGDSLYHTGADERDGLENVEQNAEFGDDPPELLEAELQKRIQEAKEAGLSANGIARLKRIVKAHQSVFRLRLGSGGPARVPPMKVDLVEGKRPIRVKVRRYPSDQRQCLDKYFDELVRFGFIRPDSAAEWQAAPHLVPKQSDGDSGKKYRITIDLRPVNAATKTEVWPMPNLETELSDFAGSEHFASLDFCAAYWQIPLHPDSYRACGIIAPQGCFSSTRVLHGLKNATSYFQATIPPLFSEIRDHFKSWLDDFSLHGKSECKLLDTLERFLTICVEYNLFLSARKCCFYSKSIKWCGRIIDKSGYSLDPRNVEALRNMTFPLTADELCQFIHCCRWMATAIPDFNRRCEPLNEILEAAYAVTGKRKKSALKKVMLSKVSWGPRHEAAFTDLQDALKRSVKLAFPKPEKAICVFTDASDRFWAGVVTQIDPDNLGKDPLEQGHQPLAFVGGRFAGAQKNWTTYEKEAFSIVKVFDKLDYILCGSQRVHIYTDHRNLLFVFAPVALRPTAPRYVLAKVHRWAIHLSRFEFNIEHIDGTSNVFADLLTRWAKGHRQGVRASGNVAALYKSIVPPASETLWPTSERIAAAQDRAATSTGQKGTDGVWRLNGLMVIPEEEEELKMEVLVAAHCGAAGHRGAGATEEKVRAEFHWKTLATDVKEFVQGCIHCITSRTGEKVPRPLSTALHGEWPNDVVHMDFLYMGDSGPDGPRYLLLIKDDLSAYSWLHPAESPDAETAAHALSMWISAFGCMRWLVTDRGSHFTANMLASLTHEAGIRHHFTTAHCPWANGTVERLCKEVLRAARALLSEWQMPPTEWPRIVSCLQSVINQSPVERLGKGEGDKTWRAPLQVFTGRQPTGIVLQPAAVTSVPSSAQLSVERARAVSNVCELHAALEEVHRDVARRNGHRRTQAQRLHNARTGVVPVNFRVGDFVMIRSTRSKSHKLEPRWRGPRRVVGAWSGLVFDVEDLVRGRVETVHAQRMVHYPPACSVEDVTSELREQAEYAERTLHVIERLVDVREIAGVFEVLVSWRGWEDEEGSTWEPILTLQEDVPDMVWDFLNSRGKRRLKMKIMDLLF